jgi:hypothetical protein
VGRFRTTLLKIPSATAERRRFSSLFVARDGSAIVPGAVDA